MDLHFFRHEILRYSAGAPNQHRQPNLLYRRMRIGTAQRQLYRSNNERFLAFCYGCVPITDWLRRYSATVLLSATTEPTLGLRTTVAWKGWKGQREHDYRWDTLGHFWMTRDRSSFLFLRRATRLRRQLQVLGVSASILS